MSNQKGFTLSELITGVGVAAIVMLILVSLLFFMNYTYLSKKDRLDAEDAAAKAELLLKMVFSQAVDVDFAGPVLPGAQVAANLGAAPGQVATGLIDRIPAAQWIKIAAFQREIQAGAAVNHGILSRTAIWFRRPEAPASAGVLFFDMGARLAANTQPAATNMQPSYADDYVPRITYLEIIPQSTNIYGKLASLEFRMRFRYHMKSTAQTTWCPQQNLPGGAAPIGACNVPGAQWQDLDRRFTVLLRNNLVRSAANPSRQAVAGGLEERILGNLYFFQPLLPGQRP